MLGWLSVCLRHAITAKPDHSLIAIKQLLSNIRKAVIPATDYTVIGSRFGKQPIHRLTTFYGVYSVYTLLIKLLSMRNKILPV